ncbi:MAG TPA: c-type cytochrome [Candidatus Saccharimonadales bacterium]|nr:c-type cytochrome [Candidatus Saccharimonadales bacterium]
MDYKYWAIILDMKTYSFVQLIKLTALASCLVLPISAGAAAKVATPAESLTVLPGFKVELIKSSDAAVEGSWVSMTVDNKGRLIIAPQGKEPILRLTLDGTGHIAKQETIKLPITSAMGLLYHKGSLYVNGVGKEGYNMYLLRDTDNDDQYDSLELIRKWSGGNGEHGSHGIVLGPDNKLYVVCGNFVDVPKDILDSSPHRNYADDLVLKRAEDGNGFGAGRKPPGGFVIRMDLDGKNAELFASGQRNTYDIAFNQQGELFGFDSDMEWDWGMPWYRPIRAFHVVSGGDYGFREGSGKWPEYYQDSLPPVVNIGVGSPTGVRFGTGAKFPAKYQKAFFMMDWTYGRIVAVHLQENGASYKGSFENFVVGKPLNVTDFEIGSDGAMYFATGGRGTQSGLYRVSYSGNESTAPVSKAMLASSKDASNARELRHKLEKFHGRQDYKAVEFAWPHLNSPDRFIRYAARITIESQPVSDWKDRALKETTTPEGGLTALLALARLGGKDVQDDLLAALKNFPMKNLSEEQKLLKLRVAEVSFARQGRPSQEFIDIARTALSPLYPANSIALNREICQILVYLEAPDVVKKTLALLAKAETQEEQLNYMFALRNLKTGWTMEDRKAYFGWFTKPRVEEEGSPAYPGGQGYTITRNIKHPDQTVQWFKDVGRDYGDGASFPKFIANLRRDSVGTLNETESTELASLISAPLSGERPAKKARVYKFVKEWTMADLAPSLEQASKSRDFARGKEAYTAAQCAACHRFGNEGGAIGPDLTAIASRFSRADVLSSIIEPSKVLSEQYQNMSLTKKDGDEVVGRILEESEDKVVLMVNPLEPDKKITLKKSDVAKRAPSKLSPMPEGLVNVLTKDEILDLIAYMESGGKKEHAAFRKN